MNIEYKVKDLIKKYNTSNIKELVDHLDISIEYQDFKAKTLDSRLMIVDSKGYIFVRSDLYESVKFVIYSYINLYYCIICLQLHFARFLSYRYKNNR